MGVYSPTVRARVVAIALLVAVIGVAPNGLDRNPEVRFAGTPHIANDGRIAFSYFGDIWVADADGSDAVRLTTHIANDFAPRFSPDGQSVVFTSTRTGNNDVFIVPSRGGEPRQLTYYSGPDEALNWLPDGRSILVASARQSFFNGQSLYRVPVDGGAEEPLGVGMARLGMMKQDGSLLAFNRVGMGGNQGVWRKGYRGNAALGIVVYDVKADRTTELTNENPRDYSSHANDAYPMWGADGQIYFASERSGPYNVWRISPRGGAPQQVTRFKEGGVFYPSISPDGRRMIFQHDFDLWTLDLPNGSPRKLTIPLSFDPKENDISAVTVNSQTTSFWPAPDGESVAVETRFDIQLVPVEQGVGEDTPVARTPWKENGQRFSPDGKYIAYFSDESGDLEVWLFERSSGNRRRLTTQSSEKGSIVWTDDSRKLLYLGDNKLFEVEVAASQPQPRELAANVAGGFQNVNYAVNGAWLSYTRSDPDQNTDVYLYDIAARKEYNVTKSTGSELLGLLTPDGKTVVFTSNRNGTGQLFAVSLSRLTEDRDDPLVRERNRAAAAPAGRGGRAGGPPDAAALAPAGRGAAPAVASAPVNIDLNGIDKRAVALTRLNEGVGFFFLSADGRTAYFAANPQGGGRGAPPATPPPAAGRGDAPDVPVQGLFSIGIDGRDRRTIATGVFDGVVPTPDRRSVFFTRALTGARLPFAPIGQSSLFRMALQGGRQEPISFSFPLRIDRRTEWQQMLNETWRVLKYRYYEPTLNGVDWDAIKSKYSPLLSSIGTNEDFYELIRAMVGELASSHMGITTGPPTHAIEPVYTTRFLGFEMSHAGDVHRIAHIYRGGPADKEWLGLSVGDVVQEINGQKIGRSNSYWQILSSAPTQYLSVKVAKTPSGDDSRVVRIASMTDIANLKYEDYVLRNRERVESRTNGRIAYAHIRTMDQPSLEQFRRDIDRDWNKEGIIVDVRYNTGGNIDQELLDILERRPYMFTNPRTGARTWGRRPQQAIAGPKVMLINERSFSDAEATPMGFRTLGLGKLVGVPTTGGVIWTSTYPLINGAGLRVPFWRAVVYDSSKPDNYGINLENYGVPPDVWVKNPIDEERKGIDRQLDAAIDEAMRALPARGSGNGGSR